MLKSILTYLFFFLISYQAFTQSNSREFTGQVFSAGQPLPFASVQLANSGKGVSADSLGQFQISISHLQLYDTLKVSHVGYKTFYLKVSELSDHVKIDLEEVSMNLDTVRVNASKIPQERMTIKKIREARKSSKRFFLNISLNEALKKAAIENKFIFLYFTAKWCGPCNWMSTYVFTDSVVAKTLSENFIPLKVDSDHFGSDKLESEFEVSGFPTFIMLDSTRQVRNRIMKMLAKDDFLTFLEEELPKGPVELSEDEIASQNFRQKYWGSFNPDIGIRIGPNFNDSNVGFSSGIFVKLRKYNFIVRPGITYKSMPTDGMKLKYLNMPVDLGYNFQNIIIEAFQVEFRAIASPYFGFLLNNRENIENTDYGLRYGLETYIGETSQFGISLLYEHGLRDIYKSELVKYNRGLVLSFIFTL